MHLSYIITIAAFASFIHSQASTVSESYPAASATSPLSTDSTDGGESIPKVRAPLRLFTIVSTNFLRRLSASSTNAVTEPTLMFPEATNTPVTGSMPPSGSSVSESVIWSDATSSPTLTAGTASMADASSTQVQSVTTAMSTASSTQVQSVTTAMSTSMGVASGNHTSSTANATNATAAAASTTSLGKKNIAGQICGFADIAGILVLIGVFAGL